MKKLVLSISIGFVVLACSTIGFTNIVRQRVRSVDYSSWMSEISDTTLIKDMNIPGTHDSIALYSIADLSGQCQSLSLEDQLKIGVRFLDIRLQLENNQLKAVHGFVDQKETFNNIVRKVDRFLQVHSSEFIIMSIKEDADAKKSSISFDSAVKEYYRDYWYTPTDLSSTTLGDVRGKAIILSRYADATFGIPAYQGWADNRTFDLPNGIHVQDEYQLDNCDTKIEAIKNCFMAVTPSLKINFLSGYIDGAFPPSHAFSVANTINPWIKKNISNYTNRGIVLYDFITSDLMKGWFE